MIRAALTLVFAVLAFPAFALEVAGPANISDGDTIVIGDVKIRLSGLDAFEDGQDCTRSGRSYNCGADAENALRSMLRSGASCTGTEYDGYGRLLATC